MEIPKDKLIQMYERMVTIRQFEENVARLLREGSITGLAHPLRRRGGGGGGRLRGSGGR